MMKDKNYFTEEKQSLLLQQSLFPQGLTLPQQLTVFMWTIINNKRYFRFLENIENGKSLLLSYRDSK